MDINELIEKLKRLKNKNAEIGYDSRTPYDFVEVGDITWDSFDRVYVINSIRRGTQKKETI